MEISEANHVNSKLAFVFPGQGSQFVGMGAKLYAESRAARDIFDEADEALGFPLSDLVFHGPAPELQYTINSQPAIMTVGIACLKAWEEMHGADRAGPRCSGRSTAWENTPPWWLPTSSASTRR